VFEAAPEKRKVILATNIAEASLTIRNVKYVVDFGVAKVSEEKTGRGGGTECTFLPPPHHACVCMSCYVMAIHPSIHPSLLH
jgi:hypothetical protein